MFEGQLCRLRAVEPKDVDAMYVWENDVAMWRVSSSTAPCSRQALAELVESMRYDIYAARQLRLIIEKRDGEAVGAVDLYDFDPQNLNVGVGILVYPEQQRGRGYASEALRMVEQYAREVLHLHQLWCCVGARNEASIALFGGAGFEQVGIKREWRRTESGYEDEIMFQKIIE
ncbi:MAG: GNAT family N-acetyltransferase [Alistipes sp.]|nr:GNAT family N-acetyltransferase [Alistipes sp.]